VYESLQPSFVLARSAKGAMYNVAVSAVTILLGFVRSVFLMRLLSPDEFGFVSLALFFVTFLAPFSTLGIDIALVQCRSPHEATYSTHFVLRLLLAAMILLFGFVVSPLLRRVYADEVINVLIVLLAANVLAASFSTPGIILRRELRFPAIAVLNLLSSVAMTVSAPLLAYLGAGVWSLVVEQVAGYMVRWLGLWLVIRPWRLSLHFDLDETKYLTKFGLHVLSSQISGILLDRFDDFWAGTVLGATALGYYSRAYEIAQYPERVLATPITSVFFPTYAALQDRKRELTQAFFRSSGFLVRVGFLMAIVMLAVIPEITLVLFGKAWLPIVSIFRLMTIYVVLDPLYVNLSYLVIGLGRPDILSRTRLLQVALFVVSVPLFASLWDVQGIAVAANLMILSGVFILLASSRRVLEFSLVRLLGWPVVALIVASAVGVALVYWLAGEGLWISMILKTICVSAAYVLVLGSAERHILREYGEWMLRALGRRLS
jgi:O-antigen/teichoic acid export membrane protein